MVGPHPSLNSTFISNYTTVNVCDYFKHSYEAMIGWKERQQGRNLLSHLLIST